MNIVIYGGTGYLGTALVSALKNSYNISIISRKSKKNLNFKNIDLLNFKRDRKEINNKIKNANLIIIANGPSSQDSKKKLFSYISFLSNETKNIHKYKNKKAKIIYFSSIHVYENYNKFKSLTKNLLNSRTHYSIRNIVCENLIIKRFNNAKKQAHIIRIGNVFGLPSNLKYYLKSMNKSAINNFCYKIVNNQKISIKSNYNESRNYVSVNDFINFIKLGFCQKKFNFSSIINYASEKELSMRKLVNVLKTQSKKLNINPKIYFENKIKKSGINYYFDISEIKKFKIHPKKNLDAEILSLLKKLKNFEK